MKNAKLILCFISIINIVHANSSNINEKNYELTGYNKLPCSDSLKYEDEPVYGRIFHVYNFSDLKSALSIIGSQKAVLKIYSIVSIKSNIIIPGNITLIFLEGGAFNTIPQCIINIEGEIKASLNQIFYNGSVLLGAKSNNTIYPEWWGAGVSKSSLINRLAINNSEFSLTKRNSGVIYFSGDSASIYRVDGTISCHSGICWDGNAVIKQDSGAKVSLFNIQSGSDIRFSNLTIDGNSSSKISSAAKLVNITGLVKRVYFRNIKFCNFKYNAVYIRGTGNDLLRIDSTHDITFDGCVFNCNPVINYIALNISGVENLTVKDCTFYNAQYSAIEFDGGYNKYARIINNTFYMGRLGHWCVEAIGAVEYAVITNNKSYCNYSGGGISTHLRYSFIANNQIINNGFYGCDRTGTEISGSNNTICGNIINNGTLSLISDGTVAHTVEYSGIRSAYDTLFCHDNTISTNLVMNKSGEAGISIYFDPDARPPYDCIKNILITCNIVIETDLENTSPIAYNLGMHRSKLSGIELKNNIAWSRSDSLIKNSIAYFLNAPFASHDISIEKNIAYNYKYGFAIDSSGYNNVVVKDNIFNNCLKPVYSIKKPYNFEIIQEAGNTGMNKDINSNLDCLHNKEFLSLIDKMQIDSSSYSTAESSLTIYSGKQIFVIKSIK